MDSTNAPCIRSTCPYCGVGCGVLLRPNAKGGLDVSGDPNHPANFGRLCSKGTALGETVGLEQRLLAPRVEGQDTDWDTALQTAADKFSQTIAEHGPDSAAFYVSGQLLTEDYYIVNKLMKGFIGSANIDTNSRLCMASSVAGHKRAFGTDTVPGTYEDIDEADLVVLVGSNLAWCHPVLYQRLLTARKNRGTKIVVIDPRRTASCDQADMHLALEPGSDVALFNALLSRINASGAVDEAFSHNVEGLADALAAAQKDDPAVTGLSAQQIESFCKLWIENKRVVTVYSQGVNQSISGTDKVNSILNCHLATGRIGRAGCGPFSVTGQPNAMGGREVGGLANMLACHLDLENADHRDAVRDFWGADFVPDKPGLKAVDMFKAVADGRIKALWIIHTNPVVSMPDADAVRDAIANCPFTVVSDITANTDTARLADVLLPATGWAEKTGTVTNSDRTISSQRAVLPAPGMARPDWDILCDVGRRMGFGDAFGFDNSAEIFREYATLSGVAGRFGRDFDISGLSDISDDEYAELTPQRWPITPQRKGGRFFADGKFFHTNGKAKMLPVISKPPAAKATRRFPFRLNTGRSRDQWHTMTRTGLSARLSAHLAEPFVEICPKDAQNLNIEHSDLVQLTSPIGDAILRARITDAVKSGQVFAPIHWTGETAPAARIDMLVAAEVDPVSGQPESKASVVAVRKYEAKWYGFAVSRREMNLQSDYWALSRTKHGYRAELAGVSSISDWEGEARRLFGSDNAQMSSNIDAKRGSARVVIHENGELLGAIFVSSSPVAVMRDYVSTLPGTEGLDALMGRPSGDVPNPGPVLCSCFGVGINTIIEAVEVKGLMSVEAIGEALGAGTNCGSCRPEIADLLLGLQSREAAE
ncbi:MAG: molybdopterin-dependent oxidoreductase [Litoreibacter sp.]|uniref:molybdopterin-dependent oxidoreductase n=1 Tax=Litoreibacter sp. TaxID=1969459 RepID=UPI00329815EA